MDGAAIAETYFDFRWMYVDVDQGRIQIQADDIRRIAVAVQHVLIGRAHCVRQQFVAYETAVDVEILRVTARLGGSRQADEAMQMQRPGAFFQWQAGTGELAAEYVCAAFGDVIHRPVIDGLAIVCQRERDIRA